MSKPLGPYTPIVRAGAWLVVSGQLGLKDGELENGIDAQTRQAIANLAELLAGEGAGLDDVVKTTVFLRHLGSDYGSMNDAYTDAFGGHRPARSAIGVAELPRGALVEIEAWARPATG